MVWVGDRGGAMVIAQMSWMVPFIELWDPHGVQSLAGPTLPVCKMGTEHLPQW